MRHFVAAAVVILVLVVILWPSPAGASDEPTVAERVGAPVSIDELPEAVAALVRAEVCEDASPTILRVSTDGQDRFEISWTAAGAAIRTAYSPDGIVLWREVEVSGKTTATRDEDEDAGAEPDEEFEREITIDLVPEPAKSVILKEAAGHGLQDVDMVVVRGQLLYDADWHMDGYEIGIGVTPEGEVVEREREEIEGDGESDD